MYGVTSHKLWNWPKEIETQFSTLRPDLKVRNSAATHTHTLTHTHTHTHKHHGHKGELCPHFQTQVSKAEQGGGDKKQFLSVSLTGM